MPGMTFSLWTCRARFLARKSVTFPALAGNAFRGVLGHRLDERIFRPRAASGPSGLRDRPRPFVIRAAHLAGCTIESGRAFDLTLNAFSEPVSEALKQAVATFGGRPGFSASLELADWSVQPVQLDLSPRPAPPCIRILIHTPLEMKGWDGRTPPNFPVLIARLRDRLSALASFHGGGPLELDHRGLVSRAQAVQNTAARLEPHWPVRLSTRTGENHALPGLSGWVEYAGPLDEFVPLLEAGYWTGVGRHTVWGHGWIEIAEPGAPSTATLAGPGA
jgi:hypothetical protein